MTLFGVEYAGAADAQLGHYFVGNAGDVDATGCGAGVRAAIAGRVHGSVEYSLTTRAASARPTSPGFLLLFAPAAVGAEPGRIHDVVDVDRDATCRKPSTRVLVLYRVSNGFARPIAGHRGRDRRRSTRGSTCRSGSRCRS